MWIMTPIGFFSVVRKPHDPPGQLTVRARVKLDLVRLSHVCSVSHIMEDHRGDYRYRVTVKAVEFGGAIARLIDSIDYVNFKNEIARRGGQRRAKVYERVWADLIQLEAVDRAADEPAYGGALAGDMPAVPCRFCGFAFDLDSLGKYGCPNCHGEGRRVARRIKR